MRFMKLPARWMILATALVGTALVSGCSGVNASHSVSPATFLLPGLLKKQPAKPAPADPKASRLTDLAVNQVQPPSQP